MQREQEIVSRCFFYLKLTMNKLLKHSKTKGQNNAQIDLKTTLKESHNRSSNDKRMVALVKFLAQRAAEEDYQFYMDALASPNKEKSDN